MAFHPPLTYPDAIETTFDAIQYVTGINGLLNEQGITLEMGSDFTRYTQLTGKARPDQPVGPPFDHRLHYLTQSNSFWIVGRDETGRVVHCQAIKSLDLAGSHLAEYLAERYLDFPPAGLALDLASSRCHPGPMAHKIRGKVCYHGDVWLDTSYRGSGVSSLLARLALITCLLHLRPDHIFAFMPEGIAFRGLTEREGYMHAEPGILSWALLGGGTVEGFMISVGQDDLRQLLRIPPRRLLKR
ncbi:hypothetical protein AAD018_003630 [Aestuariibius insulae]|uniref:hypothetical protein n=1 Tax=Aestuariibius insulae TaxID=2058287 RepID=UPI00345ED9C6